MQNEPITITTPDEVDHERDRAEPAATITWHADLASLLERAATLSVDHNVDLDMFMKGAWQAYVDARPGFREHLEDVQLRQQLAELRKQGKIELA